MVLSWMLVLSLFSSEGSKAQPPAARGGCRTPAAAVCTGKAGQLCQERHRSSSQVETLWW